MSVKLMGWVWDEGPQDAAEAMVLLALADIANDDGVCWPSITTVAKKARMSDRNARRIIRRLEEAGWLLTEVQPGRNQTNRYTIRKPDAAMSGRTDCPGGQMEQENRTNGAGKPDTAMSAEPSRTIKEPSKGAREVLCTVLSKNVADDFVAHRKAMRKPLTLRAAELVVAKLTGCRDPDAVANLSIMNGWQGVFPEREGKPRGSPPKDDDARMDRWAYIAKHGTSEGWRSAS